MILTISTVFYYVVKRKVHIKEAYKTKEMSWGYDKDNGPDTWAKEFPVANGVRQSPVDIVPGNTVHDKALAENPLTINYDDETDLIMENPGLSFKMNICADSTITGGPLGDVKYKLEQFHFHWAHEDTAGSEHTINGQMYPSELHLVHYNADKYPSFGEAVTHSDGLAVIGVFIKIGAEHAGFKTLSDNSSKVKKKSSKVNSGAKFNPASLLPENTKEYWSYEGSLTTPPLCESVSWIVMKDTIEISQEQIGAMRGLCSDIRGEKPIPANFRPPQPLKNREIKASF